MSKRSKMPSGLCTGFPSSKSGCEMPVTTFYDQIRKGHLKLEKVIPPGDRRSKEGYFVIEEVEKLAQAKELFNVTVLFLEGAKFSRAQSESDIRGIVDLCVAIYGVGGTPSFETRMDIWRKSPMSYYVLKQEDIVTGYTSLIWFNDVALEYLMEPAKKPSIIQSPLDRVSIA